MNCHRCKRAVRRDLWTRLWTGHLWDCPLVGRDPSAIASALSPERSPEGPT